MDLQLKDRIVLLVGASRGIGLATACAFAAEGCNLHLTARNGEALAMIACRLRETHQIEARTHPLDLTAEGAIKKLVEAVGDVDVLLNNRRTHP